MPAQNAAVEPLPLEPVTTTEWRESRLRSTVRASSSSAIRARQTPSPYFGRSNTQESHGQKCMAPDFQDQIAPAGFLQQPDRWAGVDLDHPCCFRVPADIRKHVDRGDAKSKRLDGILREYQRGLGTRGFEDHRSSCTQVHPPGNVPTFAFGQHDVERNVAVYGNRRKTAGSQSRVMRDQQVADGAATIAQHKGRIFSGGINDLVVEQENPVFDSRDNRLNQYRVVVLRNLMEISNQRGLAVNGLRKIAARTLQRFDECRFPQFLEMC